MQLTLPQGDYRFRSDRNGTQFWSGTTDHCTVPGCESASVTVTIPLTVTVQSQSGSPYPDLPVYAFDGDTYTGFHGTTDASGEVVFTLPQGDYRFRSDFDGVQFWSGDVNHCTVPGCLEALVEIPGGTGIVSVTINYTYDPLQRLTAADYSSGEYFHYSYDPVGNRLTQDTLAGANAYSYDIANRLTEVDGVPYTWSDNGNLLDDGTSSYAYDHANRLVEVVQGSDTYEFAYNGLGDRLNQTVNVVTTEYTLDLAAGLTQVLADGSNAYLYGLGRIGEEQPSGFAYHLGDALGSVRQLSDASNTLVVTQVFSPFGERYSAQGTSSTIFQYGGELHDDTDLIYLRARYLDTSTGRFLTSDPSRAESQQVEPFPEYLYVKNDPINAIDPTGLRRYRIWAAAFIAPATVVAPYIYWPQYDNPTYSETIAGLITPGILFPAAQYSGDNRLYYVGQSQRPSSRVWYELEIDTNPDIPLTTLPNRAGTGRSMVEFVLSTDLFGIPFPIGFGAASAKAPPPPPALTSRDDTGCITEVNIDIASAPGSGKDPLTPPATTPRIRMRYSLEFDVCVGELRVDFTHGWYPWFELWISGLGGIVNTPPVVNSPFALAWPLVATDHIVKDLPIEELANACQ